jgi:PEP-CTERM motif
MNWGIVMKFALTCALMAASIAFAAPAGATTYNVASDWSDAANPNGTWSYGPGLIHFAQPTVANALNGAAANGYWGTVADFNSPNFILRTTSSGSSIGGGSNDGDWLAGDVLVHGPNDGSFIAVNWTAPGAGMISFSSALWYAHSPVNRSQDISAFLGATSLGSVSVFNGITRISPLTSISGSALAVASGDVLSFRFAKSNGQPFGSLTGFDATVDFSATPLPAVPEPASWALMIAGFGFVGSAMRRRSKARGLSFT